MPTDLGECKSMQDDIDRIEKWAEIFKNPTELIKVLTANIIQNIPTIEQDVMKTMTDISSNEMFYAGEDVADIMVLALGPVPEMPETLKITQW